MKRTIILLFGIITIVFQGFGQAIEPYSDDLPSEVFLEVSGSSNTLSSTLRGFDGKDPGTPNFDGGTDDTTYVDAALPAIPWVFMVGLAGLFIFSGRYLRRRD